MIIYVDIDNTICKTNNSDYTNSIPLQENIDIINNLFDKGHTIIYWTARGGNSKKDYTELTKTQLLKWNCKYTELKMNKPSYDIFIDDKALTNVKDILKIIDI
jgi:hydroxymethylpyrimidine pyrophosphatase-like HAD family hydrolase